MGTKSRMHPRPAMDGNVFINRGGALIWFISLFVEISPWLYLGAVLAFYLLYVGEWLIRLLINGREAYKHVSFEREARDAQYNETYLENDNYFAWVKYLFRK